MLKKIFLFLLLISTGKLSVGQQKWNLQQCIEYAFNNNISIKQSQLQEKVAEVQYKQTRMGKYPSASFSDNEGYRFGKSQNPSTGILENRNFFSVGIGFQTGIEIFNWYSKRNMILASHWEAEAAKVATDKSKDDIALAIINAYLQILLAIEQQKIAEVQVQQTISQLINVRKLVKAGALPELNAVEIEAQLASDSSSLIAGKGNVTQAKYVLKGLLNIDGGSDFQIEELDPDHIPLGNIADLQPETIYKFAVNAFPGQRINDYKLKAARANSNSAKGALYPTISGYGSLGTSYGYSRTAVFQQIFSGYQPSGLVIPNGSGGYTDVQSPVYINGNKSGYITSDPFATQLNYNFGQSVGISISVPIFNGWSARGNYEKSKMNIRAQELQNEFDTKALKQNIYQAYDAALTSMETFSSSRKAVISAQRSFDFALKRFNAGMLTAFELLTQQNNLFKAKLEAVLNQFDYIFKIKVLEFYKGAIYQ